MSNNSQPYKGRVPYQDCCSKTSLMSPTLKKISVMCPMMMSAHKRKAWAQCCLSGRGCANSYSGPILNSNNQQCVTSRDLDEAMLETRQFWFDPPIQDDHAWQPVLELYENTPRWPPIAPPGRDVCLSTLLHTKDSVPGPDGIPYSAWRVLPEMTLQAMSSYFYDILEDTALPPTQVGVWIPKAKIGPKADNFLPLGMPNTLDRLVDGTVAAHLMHHTAHLLHPSPAVMSYFKEPQRAVAEIQRIIDGAHPACALPADLC